MKLAKDILLIVSTAAIVRCTNGKQRHGNAISQIQLTSSYCATCTECGFLVRDGSRCIFYRRRGALRE